MMQFLRAAGLVVAMMASVPLAFAEEPFKPQLQKVVVNGQILFDISAKVPGKPIEVDPTKPAKFECTFANKGMRPGEDPFMVFLHLDDGKTVVGGDYSPTTPTTGWTTDKQAVDVKAIDISSLTGQVQLFIGLYRGEDRINLINPGVDYQQRLPVGILNLKVAPAAPGAKP